MGGGEEGEEERRGGEIENLRIFEKFNICKKEKVGGKNHDKRAGGCSSLVE